MVPTVELPPAAELTDQVMEVLELPMTVAVNFVAAPRRMLAVAGETEIVREGGGGGGGVMVWLAEPQAYKKGDKTSRQSRLREDIVILV